MEKVWLLEHVHDFDNGHEDTKIIGLYSTRAKARAALLRVRDQPGFRSFPKGFSISAWTVDPKEVGWPEGFVTAYPDRPFSE